MRDLFKEIWYIVYIVIGLLSSIIQLVHTVHRDKIFKVQVLTGKSITNTKFRFVYRFSSENGKSLAPS